MTITIITPQAGHALTALLPDALTLTFVMDEKVSPVDEVAYALHWFTNKFRQVPSLVVVAVDDVTGLAAALAAQLIGIPVMSAVDARTVYGECIGKLGVPRFAGYSAEETAREVGVYLGALV